MGQIYRNTKIELAKYPDERVPVLQMLKNSKEEFDRLMETSPTIPEKILLEFKQKFSAKFDKVDIDERVVEPKYVTTSYLLRNQLINGIARKL